MTANDIEGSIISRLLQRCKSVIRKSETEEWQPILNEFKMISPTINSTQELEDYLQMVNYKVIKYESDYAFHEAYYSMIHEVRKRLTLDAKDG